VGGRACERGATAAAARLDLPTAHAFRRCLPCSPAGDHELPPARRCLQRWCRLAPPGYHAAMPPTLTFMRLSLHCLTLFAFFRQTIAADGADVLNKRPCGRGILDVSRPAANLLGVRWFAALTFAMAWDDRCHSALVRCRVDVVFSAAAGCGAAACLLYAASYLLTASLTALPSLLLPFPMGRRGAGWDGFVAVAWTFHGWCGRRRRFFMLRIFSLWLLDDDRRSNILRATGRCRRFSVCAFLLLFGRTWAGCGYDVACTPCRLLCAINITAVANACL